jgi:general secretion pathway protein M
MTLPGGAPGRLLALALLLIPVALLFRLAILPAWDAYRTQGDRIAVARDQLTKFQRLAAQLPALKQEATYLRNQKLLTPYLINASNDALAAAAVQQRLKDIIAKDQNGRVLSTRVLKGTADGPFERVIVNARLQIQLEGLQTLLYELETGQPYLFFQDASVLYRPARRRRRRGPEQQAASGLEARLTIYGLRRRSEGNVPRA